MSQAPDNEFTTTIDQQPRSHTPARRTWTQRKSTAIEEWVHLRARQHVRLSGLTEPQAEAKASEDWEELKTALSQDDLVRAMEATAPACRARDASGIHNQVQVAATLRLGPVRWLEDRLRTPANRRGPKACREMVAAVFLRVAFAKGRPELDGVREKLTSGHPFQSWAHDYPAAGPESASGFYESFQRMLETHDAGEVDLVNVELIRRLAERRGADGQLLYANVARVGIVDGCGVNAFVPQRRVVDERHRAILHGNRTQSHVVVYTNPDGSVRRLIAGYKVVAIVDLETTLPIICKRIPANGDERQATLGLLRRLFEIWPECPMETLVGDSLYDHSKAFAHELVFSWGIHPVFPRHGVYAETLEWVDTDGVPQCKCGPMKYHDQEYWPTLDWRQKNGLKRGEEVPEPGRARMRWICPNGICGRANTRPFDDPRLYTWYHRGGDHKRAYLRRALLARRNAVESVFSLLQHYGIAGKAKEVPAWASDAGIEWLVKVALMAQAARRVAHECDAYQCAHAEAVELGLLDHLSLTNPSPNITPEQLADARARRPRAFAEPEAPRASDD